MIVAALAVTACGLFPSLDDLTDGGADVFAEATQDVTTTDVAPNDGGVKADASGDADANPCPSLHGPAMVLVPSNGQSFCIDSTEVTTAQYAEFVTAVAKGATVVAPPSGVCQWNTSVVPLSNSGSCNSDTTDSDAHPNRPASCVDWCDAYAYCAWAGKRICGAIDGGALAFNNFISAANQAYVACSANATQPYPYGSTYMKGYCNTKDLYDGGVGATVADTKSFAQCVGAFPGIYDITGNVEEWVDSCSEKGEGGTNDPCHETGDCFDYTATGAARCDNSDSDYRTSRGSDIGIRCCSP
jgi:sulfatase modifying factor 1